MALFASVDAEDFLGHTGDWKGDCETLRDSLRETGLAAIRDPRADPDNNEVFLAARRKFFERSLEEKWGYINEPYFQSGWRPGGVETAPEASAWVAQLHIDHWPRSLNMGVLQMARRNGWHYPLLWEKLCDVDPGERWFDPCEDRPEAINDPAWAPHNLGDFYADRMVPEGIPEWEEVCGIHDRDTDAVGLLVLDMFSQAKGLDPEILRAYAEGGPHMGASTWAPPEICKKGMPTACVHPDRPNLLSIHKKASAPGLFGWTRKGHRFAVKLEQGYFLVQVAGMLEWLTGGELWAGYHEVIAPEGVEKTGRISSTKFLEPNLFTTMKVLPPFADEENVWFYGEQLTVEAYREAIKAVGLVTDGLVRPEGV